MSTFGMFGGGIPSSLRKLIGIESTGAEIDGKVIPVDTIATLREKTVTPETIWVSGYHSKNDGAFGSNIFRWNPTSTASDNGGTIIKLTSIATGRYELQYIGAVNVKWFGAKGDYDSSTNIGTDNSLFVQNALNAAFILYFPLGVYKYSTTLIFKQYTKIYGEGRTNTILAYSGETQALLVTNANGWQSAIEGMHVTYIGTGLTVHGINVKNVNHDSSWVVMKGLRVSEFTGTGIECLPVLANTYLTHFHFDDIEIVKCNVGFNCGASDSLFSNFNIWNSKKEAMNVTIGNSLFNNFKIDQNGNDGRYNAINVSGNRNKLSNFDIQQNTAIGLVISGNDNICDNITLDCNSVPVTTNLTNTDNLYPNALITGNYNKIDGNSTNFITVGSQRSVIVSPSTVGNIISIIENTPLSAKLFISKATVVKRTATSSLDYYNLLGTASTVPMSSVSTPMIFTNNPSFSPVYDTLIKSTGLLLSSNQCIESDFIDDISNGFHYSFTVSPKNLNTVQTYFFRIGEMSASFISGTNIGFYINGAYAGFAPYSSTAEKSITVTGTFNNNGERVLTVSAYNIDSSGTVVSGGVVFTIVYNYSTWSKKVYVYSYSGAGIASNYALGVSNLNFGLPYNTSDIVTYTKAPSVVTDKCNLFYTYNNTLLSKCLS